MRRWRERYEEFGDHGLIPSAAREAESETGAGADGGADPEPVWGEVF